MTVKEVRERLQEMADPSYKEFNDRLIPRTAPTFGTRVPEVRKTARMAARHDAESYLQEAEALAGQEFFQEERMVQGMVIGYAKMELKTRLDHLDKFVPEIGSWAVCDYCTSTLKFIGETQEPCWDWVIKWLGSEREYEQRFGIVALMNYYVTDRYIVQMLQLFSQVKCSAYYARMGLAWAVSVCYVKFPGQTRAFLGQNQLDAWTQNKAIQKIRESLRVSREAKEELLWMKRL